MAEGQFKPFHPPIPALQMSTSSLCPLLTNLSPSSLTLRRLHKSTLSPEMLMREAKTLAMPGVLLSDFLSVFCRCCCSRVCVSLFFEDERVVMSRCSDWVCGRRKRNSSMRRQQVEKPRPLCLYVSRLSVIWIPYLLSPIYLFAPVTSTV
jgi:hypothetical protein